jgi:hypothetical protein
LGSALAEVMKRGRMWDGDGATAPEKESAWGGKADAAEGDERRGALGGEEGPLPSRERDGLQSTRES